MPRYPPPVPILLLTTLLAGCSEQMLDADVLEAPAKLLVHASLPASLAGELVVEVTGPDIDAPLVFNIPVAGTSATGTITLPTGSQRDVTVSLFDAGAVETHRGSATIAVLPGANPPVSITLTALVGDQDIHVTIGSVMIQVGSISGERIFVGTTRDTARFAAFVIDVDGDTLDVPIQWLSLDPSIATVDESGLVQAVAPGEAMIVAAYGQIGGMAVQRVGDFEELVEAAFGTWWQTAHSVNGPLPGMANQSFMWSAFPANFGMVHYSGFPRVALVNSPHDEFYHHMLGFVWTELYRTLAIAADVINSLEESGLDADQVIRARAFSRFVQGLAHASLALLYDEAFIADETTGFVFEEWSTLGAEHDYLSMLEVAVGYLDDAEDLARTMTLTIPQGWMSVAVSTDQLVRLIRSLKARYRAGVARNPAERAAVDWAAVIADVEAGIESTWSMRTGYFVAGLWNHQTAAYMAQHPVGWQQVSYFLLGMADQSGRYQAWIQLPHVDKHPDLPDGGPFLIQTPDLRFPQGDDLEAQLANPGIQHIETPGHYFVIGPRDWRNPERGTHRWSYYRAQHMEYHRTTPGTTPTPEVTRAEMNLLKAEALLHTGDLAGAAALINTTRERAGLDPTDGAGTNVDCVPRLWTGSCGDLFEMLKWEKRIETQLWGVHSNSWFFDGRGWGDLYIGTPVSLPVPCHVREARGEPCHTTGGVGGPQSAPRSVYAFPFES